MMHWIRNFLPFVCVLQCAMPAQAPQSDTSSSGGAAKITVRAAGKPEITLTAEDLAKMAQHKAKVTQHGTPIANGVSRLNTISPWRPKLKNSPNTSDAWIKPSQLTKIPATSQLIRPPFCTRASFFGCLSTGVWKTTCAK